MPIHSFTRRGRCLAAASMIALSLGALASGSRAMAQTVTVFDEAPSLETLRSIMIPESQPGSGRSIVIQRPDAVKPNANVQAAAVKLAQPAAAAQPAPVSAPASVGAMASAGTVANPVTGVDPGVGVDPGTGVNPGAAGAGTMSSRPEAAAAKPGTVGFRINFAFNTAVLPGSAHAMIDEVAQIMKEAPEIRVRVEGHTDAAGSPGYNINLSERRALSVAEYLVKQGIEPSRLVLIGKGMTEPLTRNPYDPSNRRVQFVRLS